MKYQILFLGKLRKNIINLSSAEITLIFFISLQKRQKTYLLTFAPREDSDQPALSQDNTCQGVTMSQYSRTLMARTPMARLSWLIRTRFLVPTKFFR